VIGGSRTVGRMSDIKVLIPADNELTDARVDLGRRLFFDGVLSGDRSVSCSTCHKPELAFADNRPVAVGVFGRVGKRHSPSLVNRGLGRSQFWDGRAETLEELALMPLRDVNEMDLSPDEAILRLSADASYRAAFQTAFGRPPSAEDLGRALASFVRVVRSENSAYDRFVAGDEAALTSEQQRGLEVFRSKGRCFFCHTEPAFTDESFSNIGVAWRPGSGGFQDDGQYAVTGNDRDRGSFKTPTLREIARTAPYMHDGSLATLDAVVDFYDQGGRRNPNLYPVIHPLGLTTEEKRALVRFLESLSGEVTTALARDRTSPDFSGVWTTSPSPTEAPPLWGGGAVTITQSPTTLTIVNARTASRRLYNLTGAVQKFNDRSRGGNSQEVSAQASWRDWQLVVTTSEFLPGEDGTPVMQEITQVFTLASPSAITVHVTRQGAKTDHWTVKLQRLNR
jgi:cytochrome c peroxidase